MSAPTTSLSRRNPTDLVDLSFERYLQQRQSELQAHLVDGIPDYAFSLDAQLRQRLAAVGPVRALARAMTAGLIPVQRQLQMLQGVAVGPHQFPEIYAMGEACARRLGIGVPEIFIYPQLEMNASTFAVDDVAPMIVLTSGLVENFAPAELLFVIGHECGHIHNLHGIYNTAVEVITNPLASVLLDQVSRTGLPVDLMQMAVTVVQGGLSLFFARWSRCAEVTCDRAGLICCGDQHAAEVGLARLGAGEGHALERINIDEYLRQIASVQETPLRLLELGNTHPIIPKRIQALREFAHCDVLGTWRPELRAAGPALSKAQVDQECERFISVWATGYDGQTGAH